MSELPIVRKLTRKHAVLHDADRLHSTLELNNPDGPEAATLLKELVGGMECIVTELEDGERNNDLNWGHAQDALNDLRELLAKARGQ